MWFVRLVVCFVSLALSSFVVVFCLASSSSYACLFLSASLSLVVVCVLPCLVVSSLPPSRPGPVLPLCLLPLCFFVRPVRPSFSEVANP